MDVATRARERLRDRGLPQTPMYLDAELRRMALEEERKSTRRGVQGPRRPGALPRAEPEEVVAETERDASGKFAGRLTDIVAIILTSKKVFSAQVSYFSFLLSVSSVCLSFCQYLTFKMGGLIFNFSGASTAASA